MLLVPNWRIHSTAYGVSLRDIDESEITITKLAMALSVFGFKKRLFPKESPTVRVIVMSVRVSA